MQSAQDNKSLSYSSTSSVALASIGLSLAYQVFRFRNLDSFVMGDGTGVIVPLLAMAVTAVLAAIWCRPTVSLLKRTGAVIGATVLMSAVLLTQHFAVEAGWWQPVGAVSNVLAVIVGAMGVVLMLAWFERLVRLFASDGLSLTLFVLIGSVVLSMLFPLMFFSYSPFPWLFTGLYPICCGLCLWRYDAVNDPAALEEEPGINRASKRPREGMSRGLPSRMMLVLIVALDFLGNAELWLMDETLMTNEVLWLSYVVSIIACCGLLFSYFYAKNKGVALFIAWFVIALVMALGLSPVWQHDGTAAGIVTVLLSTCTACSEILILLLVVAMDDMGTMRKIRWFALAYCLTKPLACLGSTITLVLVSDKAVISNLSIAFEVIATTLLVLALGFKVITEYRRESEEMFGEVEIPAVAAGLEHPAPLASLGGASNASVWRDDGGQQPAIGLVAQIGALTPRETVIMSHLVKGYSLQHIAEVEGVALSTVKSQSRNLYRKLNIHTRQELIDLVESTKQQTRTL